MKKIYLDYASTTPVDLAVLRGMLPYFSKKFGNPGSVHSLGQEAIKALDESRQTIADALGAGFHDIIFTGSATEANNLVLRGVFKAAQPFFKDGAGPKIITSGIEHESIIETCRDLEKEGAEVVYLPVSPEGLVDLNQLKEEIDSQTVLVSIMRANNEIGAVEPLAEISEIINDFKAHQTIRANSSEETARNSLFNFPLFHTDAVQAFQYFNCHVGELGVDFMTLSAHKIYGPKGVGALYARSDALGHKPLAPIISGGGQEFGMRSGTENVPLAVGFAKAVELALKNRKQEAERIYKLRNYFWQGFKKIYPRAELNGPSISPKPLTTSPKPLAHGNRLPNNLNVYLPKQEAQFFLTALDLAGVMASAGSACRARSIEPSYVIRALGFNENRARNSLRFSLGRHTNKADIDEALGRIKSRIFRG